MPSPDTPTVEWKQINRIKGNNTCCKILKIKYPHLVITDKEKSNTCEVSSNAKLGERKTESADL